MAFAFGAPVFKQFALRKSCQPRRSLVCKAVLNLEPPTKTRTESPVGAVKRDVRCEASSADGAEALPLPEEQPSQPAITPSFLDAVVDNTVKLPYTAYSAALEKHPFATKAATSAVGFILGDIIAQHMGHHHGASIDVLRAVRLGAYGLFIDGPVGSMWYEVLERYVFPNEPVSTKAVLAKTALDQVVYATIMTGVYFAVIRMLEGHPESIIGTLQSKFVPTLAANYMIWPLAHLVNFRFVPSQYRILYNNVVAIFWLSGLSYLTHTKINFMSLLHLTH